MDEPFETVFTETEYYDGPRAGIANFCGKPHYYECLSPYNSTLFRLTPISSEVFDLALEDWAIWRRWSSAHREGRVSEKTHPALLDDRPRHLEIKAVLDQKLTTDEENCVMRRGIFRVVHEAGREPGLEVCWADPNEPGDSLWAE